MIPTDTQKKPGRIRSAGQGLQPALALAGVLRQRIHDMGLLPRLLMAEVVVFVVLFAGGSLLINQMTDSLWENIAQGQLLVGKAIAEDLDASLGHSIIELTNLAAIYQLAEAGSNPAEIQASLDLLAEESAMFTRGILIVGPEGNVLASDQHHAGQTETDQQYWSNHWNQWLEASAAQEIAFSVSEQPSPLIAIAVPLGNGSNGEYVVGLMDVANSYPAQIVARSKRLGETGHANIFDNRRGLALFSTQKENLLRTIDHPAFYQRLLEKGEAVITETPHEANADGATVDEPHLMAFVPLSTMPWAISIGTTVSEASAPIQRLWYTTLGFSAFLTGLAFLATVFVGHWIVQPVIALGVAAKRVAEDDRAVVIRSQWGGEIGQLARDLETMRLRLHAWGSELEVQVRERTSELTETNRNQKALYETLQRKEEQLHGLLGKVLGAQEDERGRVSRELHDGIGQALSGLTIELERLEQASPDQWLQLHGHVAELKNLAMDTLGDLRRMIIALRPAVLNDFGLVPAIRWYAEFYLGNAGIDFEVREEGLDSRPVPSLETVIYRIVQEAINNVSQHSEANWVGIDLRLTDGILVVTIEDNGQGFDPTRAMSGSSVGLEGMEERASLAGGRLSVASQPGEGTTVRLEIPLTEKGEIPRDA
ncbi:MAG: sensor histidine kinase [Dehalococcoidia bacterium]